MRKLILFLYLILLGNNGFAQEPKKLKFFNIDLHIAVISDVKYIFEELGHEVETNSISNQAWLLDKNKTEIKIISQKNWKNLDDELIEKFYHEYKDYLNQFDGFIVTHAASLALLYEKFNKPIIIVNSTRYSNNLIIENKLILEKLNKFLKAGVGKNKIFIVSNNKGDQHYLKYHTGLDSEFIPSLCLYTKAKYRGINPGFIAKDRVNIDFNILFENKNLITKIDQGYKWQELYDYKGVVHFPYQISTMSLYEQYSANVPLFFPSKSFLIDLHYIYPRKILSELSFYQVKRKIPRLDKDNPDNYFNKEIIKQWIDYADFYDPGNMPYIQYFNNFAELEYLLEHSDLKQISIQMEEYNKIRKKRVFRQWKAILDKLAKNFQKNQ